jgi:hypothetical protein
MSILRGVGKGVGGVLFTTFLVSLIFLIGIVQLTEYENMKSVFTDIFNMEISGLGGQIGLGEGVIEQAETEMTEEEMMEIYQEILRSCEDKDVLEISISEAGEMASIDCDVVRSGAERIESEGIKSVIKNIAAAALFDNIYYKEYSCGLLDCMQTGEIGFMLSAQGHESFKRMQLYLIVGIVAGAVIILASAETWPSRLKGLGWPLVLTGISYFFMGFAKSFINSKLPNTEQVGFDMMPIVDKMLAPMMNIFLIVLVAGIALTAGGYVLVYKEKEGKEGIKSR